MVLELALQENSLVEPHQTILVLVAEAEVVRFHDTQNVTHLHTQREIRIQSLIISCHSSVVSEAHFKV